MAFPTNDQTLTLLLNIIECLEDPLYLHNDWFLEKLCLEMKKQVCGEKKDGCGCDGGGGGTIQVAKIILGCFIFNY